MRKRTCCVPGCNDKTAPRHYIPTEKRIRDIWIQRIGNSTLSGLTENPKALKSFVICEEHFDKMCQDANGRLLKYSLPTLNLPGFALPSTRETCFNFPEKPFTFVTPEKVREILKGIMMPHQQTPENIHDGKQSTSKENISKSLHFELNPEHEPQPSTSGTSGISRAAPSVDPDLSGIDVLPCTPSPEPVIKSVKRQLPSDYASTNTVKGLLASVDVTRQSSLTPKARTLYSRARHLQRIAAKYRVKNLATRQKLNFLQKNLEGANFLKDVNETTINFMLSQQRTQKHKPRGRRFSLEDKIFSLAIYKQSAKTYRYLSKIFSLPSRKVLSGILNKIPFNAGINAAIFDHLAMRVKKLRPLDKYCVMMFDEISLEPGVQYNMSNDSVEGFVDFGGSNRRASFADHALVFLLKGIHKKWKMPICFFFCDGTTPTSDLVRILKDAIRQVRRTGLTLVATISDQGATNQAAINNLLNATNAHFVQQNVENRLQGYLVDDLEVIHMYDFPHLMKGIRNGLLKNDLHFTQQGEDKVASWKHIAEVYKMDKNRGAYSQFIKLTDEHIFHDKIKKMRVKSCTQVFSHTVATAMHLAARLSVELSPQSKFYLDPEACGTADLLLFFDKLFDSVNGSMLHSSPGKELRSVVTKTSDHISFWQTCLPTLNSMFFTSTPFKRTVTPSIKNWIFSLRSLIYLTPKLLDRGFKHIATRNFNQDPVENHFSCVRSHSGPNTNPTCFSFVTSNKALLVNNLVSSHSITSNCETDESDGVLDNLRCFITKQQHVQFEPPNILQPVFPRARVDVVKQCYVQQYTTAYVAGFVTKKILKLRDCQTCYDKMCSSQDMPENILIRERQYEGSRLAHPSSNFSKVFHKCTQCILIEIPKLLIMYGVKARLRVTVLNYHDNILQLFCSQHAANVDIFVSATINIVLHSYLTNLNRIFKGTDLSRAKQDPFTMLAFRKYQKRRKR